MVQVDSSGNLTCSVCDSASWVYSEETVPRVPHDSPPKMPNEFQLGQSEEPNRRLLRAQRTPENTAGRHSRFWELVQLASGSLGGKDERENSKMNADEASRQLS